MSNRAQRRAAKKQLPGWQKMTKEAKLASLFRNGITEKDLRRSYEEGRLDGVNGTYKACFAAACLAMNELHGFGTKRCCGMLAAMQRYILDSLTSAEAVQSVYDKMHLKLDFGDPEDWVQVVHDDE